MELLSAAELPVVQGVFAEASRNMRAANQLWQEPGAGVLVPHVLQGFINFFSAPLQLVLLPFHEIYDQQRYESRMQEPVLPLSTAQPAHSAYIVQYSSGEIYHTDVLLPQS
jgi:hypothetical protein